MQVHKFQNKEDWLNFRKGKISGTRLKDIIVKRGTGQKKGYYELIAERLAVTEETSDGYIPNETPMDRGTRLQKFAIERFRQETGKRVDESLIIWSSDDNNDITISPDGVISKTEALEVKCLSSASHIEAYLKNEVPDEYKDQGIQYFIVNEKLKKLYFVFYDPRIPAKDYFTIEIKREDIEEQIKLYKEFQIKTIAEINEIVNKLLNF